MTTQPSTIEEQMKATAAELRAETARRGLTYTDVAERAEMNVMTVSRYMRGERDIPLSRLVAMCNALDVSPTTILERAIR